MMLARTLTAGFILLCLQPSSVVSFSHNVRHPSRSISKHEIQTPLLPRRSFLDTAATVLVGATIILPTKSNAVVLDSSQNKHNGKSLVVYYQLRPTLSCPISPISLISRSSQKSREHHVVERGSTGCPSVVAGGVGQTHGGLKAENGGNAATIIGKTEGRPNFNDSSCYHSCSLGSKPSNR